MKKLMDQAFQFIEDQSLVITRPGVRISKEKDRLKVYQDKKLVAELPFFRIKSVTLASNGVSLSTDLLRSFSENEIEVLFLEYNGKPFGSFVGAGYLTSARIRREQFRAFDTYKGIYLIKTFVLAKIGNQIKLLQYFNRADKMPVIKKIIDEIKTFSSKIENMNPRHSADIQQTVMGYEGIIARKYWQGVMALLKGKIKFAKRETRSASDVVNYCFNYGYAILYGEIWRALLRTGLDPYAGFLHADQDGRPSLIYDFAEEFRQPLVDRGILSSLRKNWKPSLDKDGKLDLKTRKHLLNHVKDNLERENYKISIIISNQAKSLAKYLVDDGVFKPYKGRWW